MYKVHNTAPYRMVWALFTDWTISWYTDQDKLGCTLNIRPALSSAGANCLLGTGLVPSSTLNVGLVPPSTCSIGLVPLGTQGVEVVPPVTLGVGLVPLETPGVELEPPVIGWYKPKMGSFVSCQYFFRFFSETRYVMVYQVLIYW